MEECQRQLTLRNVIWTDHSGCETATALSLQPRRDDTTKEVGAGEVEMRVLVPSKRNGSWTKRQRKRVWLKSCFCLCNDKEHGEQKCWVSGCRSEQPLPHAALTQSILLGCDQSDARTKKLTE